MRECESQFDASTSLSRFRQNATATRSIALARKGDTVNRGRMGPTWGRRPTKVDDAGIGATGRIVGELRGVGISVSATSVRKVLLEEGLPPAAERMPSSWRAFLRAQAASVLAEPARFSVYRWAGRISAPHGGRIQPTT
jgi:hypothetical protein